MIKSHIGLYLNAIIPAEGSFSAAHGVVMYVVGYSDSPTRAEVSVSSIGAKKCVLCV